MTNDCHIAARELSVSFAESTSTLADVTLEFARGEFVALIGPSGCGKSTFLRCVAGLQAATRGQLLFPTAVNGRPKMAYVFQDSTLLPWRTVLQNIALPLEIGGMNRQSRTLAAQAALERCGLAPSDANKRPGTLSGGMRMRVSLARAWVTQPEVLLLDEPFAALDDISRQYLNEELQRLWQQQQWTTLFVTHNVSEAVFLSQRVLVMSRRPGRIVADVAVPLAYPRTVASRSTPDFVAVTARVTDLLREAAA